MDTFEVDLPTGTVEVKANNEYEAYVKALQMQRQAQQVPTPQAPTVQAQRPEGTPTPDQPIFEAGGLIAKGAQERIGEMQRGLTGQALRFGEMMGIAPEGSVDLFQQALQRERDQRSVMDQPVDRTFGEYIGGALPDIALGLGAGGTLRAAGRGLSGVMPRTGQALQYVGESMYMPRTAPQAALGGALYGQTMPYASGQEAMVGTGATALAGGVAQPFLRAAGLTGQPASQLPQAQQEAARRAIEAGFQFPVSEMTGSATGRFLGEGLKALPFGRGAYDALAEGNQKTVNTIVNRSIGLPANIELTPTTLQSVKDSAITAYDNLQNIPTIKLDQQFANSVDALIAQLSAGAKSTRGETGATKALNVLQDFRRYVNSGLDGEGVKQNLRSLTDLAFQASKQGKIAGQTYKTLREEFENAIDRSLNNSAQSGLIRPDLIQNYRDARQKLANVFVVENAFDEATGKISGKKIASALSKRSDYGTRGTDLETAAIGSTVFPEYIGSSGTAERTQSAELLKGLFTGGAGAAGMYGAIQDPTIAALAGGSLIAPYLAGRAATAKPIRDIVARRQLGAIPPDESKIAAGMRMFEQAIPETARYGLGAGTRAMLERYLNRGLLGE
jgi:hypothetical protein